MRAPMRCFALALALSPALIGCRTAAPVPEVELTKTVWQDYDALLAEVVTDDGRVDYAALEANREPLDAVLAWFANDRLYGRANERGALWINAYNAFVLAGVLEAGTPESVLDVDGWLPVDGAGFFLERSYSIDGNRYVLWEVEQERILHRRLDYRLHAALVRGTAGSPPLRPGIYTGDGLELELNAAMRSWVNDAERGVRIVDGGVAFPEDFAWFTDDFWRWSGEKSACVLVASYADAELKAAAIEAERAGCPMVTHPHDWSLNAAR